MKDLLQAFAADLVRSRGADTPPLEAILLTGQDEYAGSYGHPACVKYVEARYSLDVGPYRAVWLSGREAFAAECCYCGVPLAAPAGKPDGPTLD